MAKAGQEVHNPRQKDRIVFRETGGSGDGRRRVGITVAVSTGILALVLLRRRTSRR
jgi:hypothetical protein